ncbi:hypothetical protein K0M31_014024 [Melipona bicolor]|uniref:Uncharacterized protein n=1 Tax=Melipona bicolor TaxID=60889 RepID=A0AA40G7P6_9HYME|nr:hypothetical protein K0M31_014024 [Melipona bicolor]
MAKDEGSPVGYRPRVPFVWFVEATTEKSPRQAIGRPCTLPACLPACLPVLLLLSVCLSACPMTDDSSRPTRSTTSGCVLRTETNFFQALAGADTETTADRGERKSRDCVNFWEPLGLEDLGED